MDEKLVVAVIQADLAWENIEGNRSKFHRKIHQVSPEVDLVILPEMFTTGFTMNASPMAEPEHGPSLEWMKELAIEKDLAITGSLIITEGGKYYNRLYFVYPDGTFRKYDKRHTFTLAGEHEVYNAGEERLVLMYKGWKICPLVCYDLRFPVWSRNTEAYDLLLYVANWPAVRTLAWDTLLRARAIENMCYCAGVNRVGKDGNNHSYLGHSAVFDCLGSQISQKEYEREFLEEITLNKHHLMENRARLKFLQDADDFTLKALDG